MSKDPRYGKAFAHRFDHEAIRGNPDVTEKNLWKYSPEMIVSARGVVAWRKMQREIAEMLYPPIAWLSRSLRAKKATNDD